MKVLGDTHVRAAGVSGVQGSGFVCFGHDPSLFVGYDHLEGTPPTGVLLRSGLDISQAQTSGKRVSTLEWSHFLALLQRGLLLRTVPDQTIDWVNAFAFIWVGTQKYIGGSQPFP